MVKPQKLNACLGLPLLFLVGSLISCGGGDENRVPVLPVKGRVLLDAEPAVGRQRQKRPVGGTRKTEAGERENGAVVGQPVGARQDRQGTKGGGGGKRQSL